MHVLNTSIDDTVRQLGIVIMGSNMNNLTKSNMYDFVRWRFESQIKFYQGGKLAKV